MMPIAGLDRDGTGLQEGNIASGLGLLALAMIATRAVVPWRLRGADDPEHTASAPLQE